MLKLAIITDGAEGWSVTAGRISGERAPNTPEISQSCCRWLGWFARHCDYCERITPALESVQVMQDHTETLRVGAKAPEFTLFAANRQGEFTLTALVATGALILEFLRGTW